MTPARPESTITPHDFPALRDFLAGYLHEEYEAEHRTPQGAIDAFCRDATAEELRRLQDDAARFAAAIGGMRWRDVRRALRQLGAAWAPRSAEALAAFLRAIAAATSDR
jgi:hypothetical protein